MADLTRILRLLRPFWQKVLLALLLGALTIGSSIALMMTSAWLISTAALQLGIASLGVAPVGVRLFGLSRALFRYLERLLSHDVTFHLLARLRVWFYTRIEPLSPAQLGSYRSGDLMARAVADIEELQNFYQRVVAPPVAAVLITLLTGWVFSWFDPAAALTAVGFMLVSGVLLPMLAWSINAGSGEAVVAGRARLNSHLIDTIQGLADSLAFGDVPKREKALEEIGRELTLRERHLGRLDGLQSGLTTLVVNLAALGVLWIALERVEGVYLAGLALGTIAAFEAINPLALAGQHLGGKWRLRGGSLRSSTKPPRSRIRGALSHYLRPKLPPRLSRLHPRLRPCLPHSQLPLQPPKARLCPQPPRLKLHPQRP